MQSVNYKYLFRKLDFKFFNLKRFMKADFYIPKTFLFCKFCITLQAVYRIIYLQLNTF